MKLKKKKKAKRMRGTRLHGFAAKKHKGSGNRGGKGMAGTGKRAGQRKTWVLKYMHPYFGKKGFTSRKTEKKKNKVINLRDIEKNLKSYIKQGIAKNTVDYTDIELKDYKILGECELKEKLIIKADSFSKKAREKIEKAGGKAIGLKERKRD